MGKAKVYYAEYCVGGCGRKSATSSNYCGKKDQRHQCMGVSYCAGCGLKIAANRHYCPHCHSRNVNAARREKENRAISEKVERMIAERRAARDAEIPAPPPMTGAAAVCYHCGGLCRWDNLTYAVTCWNCGRPQKRISAPR